MICLQNFFQYKFDYYYVVYLAIKEFSLNPVTYHFGHAIFYFFFQVYLYFVYLVPVINNMDFEIEYFVNSVPKCYEIHLDSVACTVVIFRNQVPMGPFSPSLASIKEWLKKTRVSVMNKLLMILVVIWACIH